MGSEPQFCATLIERIAKMQLTQLVYASSYIDEYGLELPEFIENSALGNGQMGVFGMTLFSNGNIIQLLEGPRAAVRSMFSRLPLDAKQFQVSEIFQGALDAACIDETSIGFSLHSLRLITKPPSIIELFRLRLDEVRNRVRNSAGKTLMERFAIDYQ